MAPADEHLNSRSRSRLIAPFLIALLWGFLPTLVVFLILASQSGSSDFRPSDIAFVFFVLFAGPAVLLVWIALGLMTRSQASYRSKIWVAATAPPLVGGLVLVALLVVASF